MTGGTTAASRLERLLYVIPAAMREEGADLSELAATLDASERRIREDLEELGARSYYRPGGWPDDVQILMEPGRVRVHHATGFERPVRLSRDETLCLALALRSAAASAYVFDDEARSRLLARAEEHLGRAVKEVDGTVAAPDGAADPEGIRETVVTAARERLPCALWYVKPGARDGSLRVVHPYAIAHGEGASYAVAHCTVEEDVRVFRLDRVLAADVADGTFTVPDDFRAEDYLSGGRVYDGSGGDDVRVRYSPRIARWIRERARHEPERIEATDDGAVLVRHTVADPMWAVGHALGYGAEAEVVEPEEVRSMVREVAEEIAARAPDGSRGRSPPAGIS